MGATKLLAGLALFLSAVSAGAGGVSGRTASPQAQPQSQWSGWGGNIRNNRWASQNTAISSGNILSITSYCNLSFPVGVSATPVVSGNAVFFPTWDGAFVALDFQSCNVLWTINVTAIVHAFAPVSPFQAQHVRPLSRTSPQIDGNVVYFGTLTHALIVAVSKTTGATLGVVQIHSHPLAIVTMSPTFFDGKLFVGASSVEENVTPLPGYRCCSFVGSVVALSFNTASKKFKVLWNVASISKARQLEGWAGAAIWGSQPPIDTGRRLVFVGTGNSYSVSNATVQCQTSWTPPEIPYTLNTDTCLPSDVWQDSILAIDIDHGHVKWVQQRPGVDIFTAACGYPGFGPQDPTLCPGIPGPDYDFGMAPTFVPAGNGKGDRLIVGRKSGGLYSLSAQDGHILWATSVGPGGITGGLSWGIAVDDSHVYFTVVNGNYKTWQLQPSGQTINRSAYGAVSLATGAILWQTPVPLNGVSLGPPTVVGDLVLVARTGQDPDGTASYDATQGGLVALRKTTGGVVTDVGLSSNFHGGVAIQGKYLLLGTGYSGFGASAPVPGGFHVMKVVT
ncbi:quinon protein alcohol dehydrogenase-like superfamily [Lasiosphaeria hispida]|uniref:Quinon protein alcohol dehydrogenase-like superfamily n=1 Tax=Lasiosphaeria hispida TaxID=260671 RepID=A0AAJ0MEL8_9PEZI|nr:quinon protein alcohol dehydrogenase-like superfamily [Lasiosphaeria hispida]